MGRALVTLHRWIGIALCLLFLAWFASGMVMLYVPFPSFPTADRLANAASIDVSRIDSLSAPLAHTGITNPSRIRLIQGLNEPLLVVEDESGLLSVASANSPRLIPQISKQEAEQIAARYSESSIEEVSDAFEYDQWIVHQQFDSLRPFYRVTFADEAKTQIYISSITGEVRQRTTGFERTWNYFGAVVHWIYPTFIRKSWALWDQLVWWLSLFGIMGAAAGIVLGIQRLQLARRRGETGLASPYVGWMRWHHKLGLVLGIVVSLWIFSGWLSMDHGRLFSVPDPSIDQVQGIRGISLVDATAEINPASLSAFTAPKEIEISALNSKTIVSACNALQCETRVISQSGEVDEVLTNADAELAVSLAWPDNLVSQSTMVKGDDIYANLREGSLGNNVLRIQLNDPSETWVHVNMDNGKIVSVMDRSRRVYRWLYNGIHSLDLPGLVNNRPLWDIVMIVLMMAGMLFSVTGVVLAFRHLRRAV